MGMTITEKTLAAATDEEVVEPDDLIYPQISLMAGTEFTIPQVYKFLQNTGVSNIVDPEKIAVVNGHYHLGADDDYLQLVKDTQHFVKSYAIDSYFNESRGGVPYLHLSDHGYVIPGDVVIGSGVHASAFGAIGAYGMEVGSTDLAIALTLGQLWIEVPESIRFDFHGEPDQVLTGKDYGLAALREAGKIPTAGLSLEFHGEALDYLTMGDRFTLADMTMDFGALNGILQPNDKVLEYLAETATREAEYYFPDDDADYVDSVEIDVETLEPMVQEVHNPDKIYSVSAVQKDIPMDQVIIGGCGGGTIDDFRMAARVLKYRKIHPDTRMLIIPGSNTTYQQLVNEGLASIFTELGAKVISPMCGPCPDSSIGRTLPGKRSLVTSRGRLFHPDDQVWSGSVATAAASAVTGVLSDPRDLVGGSETATME